MSYVRARLLAGAVVATALAATVGTSSAHAALNTGPSAPVNLLPGLLAAPASPALADDPVPTFKNGLAQPVYTTDSTQWITGEAWVQAEFDSDGDGKPDLIHVDYAMPPQAASGQKFPVIMEDSPYFAGTASQYSNWNVDHPLGQPPATRPATPFFPGKNTSPTISGDLKSPWISRGFAVAHMESPGTGWSQGCPTSGGSNETLAAKDVVEWLTGHRTAYTSLAATSTVSADWSTGHVGMTGTSYNGTLPEGVATTGVQGLDAIIPVSAISDWYEYYRANGMVRAPSSRTGGVGGTNSYLGEDLDVLMDDVYSRQDENPTGARTICLPELANLKANIDRASGNRSAFWDERDYMKDVKNVHAAALIAHGNNDFNVMTKNAVQFYDALKAQGVPHMFYFHQGGHGGNPPDVLMNLWFTRYLYGVQNGVESMPKSWVVREPATCPPRQTTVTADASNTTTLSVADNSALTLGFTLTVPVTSSTGAITNSNVQIVDKPDAHTVVLASAVATAAGSKVASGTTVSFACSTANPTPYAEWPDPATSTATLNLTAGGTAKGGLTIAEPDPNAAPEKLTDDASVTATTSMDTVTPNRLVYQMPALSQNVRISGTPWVTLNMAFSAKANLEALLVSYPPNGGAGTILTRGWLDPENRNSDYVSDPIVPGTFYSLHFDMQPKDTIVPAGNRIGLMVISSDHDFTVRPPAGTQLTLDLAHSSMQLPIVGGVTTLAQAAGWNATETTGTVGGTVGSTLGLTLGDAPTFGTFTPGVSRTYTTAGTANVVSSAGDATLSVSDPDTAHPGRLVNGTFALRNGVQVQATSSGGSGTGYQGVSGAPATLESWTGPVANDAITLGYRQSIASDEGLRTGSYAKTLTFTLSTTTP